MKKARATKSEGVEHELKPAGEMQQNLSDEMLEKYAHSYLAADKECTDHWQKMMDAEVQRRQVRYAVPVTQREDFLKILGDLRRAEEIAYINKQEEQTDGK